MKKPQPRRLNRWALRALLDCQNIAPSRFAVHVTDSHGTVFDALSGRRDASVELVERMAEQLEVPVEAISTDPYGVVGPLLEVAKAARRLVAGDGADLDDLRATLDDLAEAGL